MTSEGHEMKMTDLIFTLLLVIGTILLKNLRVQKEYHIGDRAAKRWQIFRF